jgi:rhodanese-related sulfurtransferase
MVLIGLILSACSTAKAQPKIVMGSSTGESSCAKETPGTVAPCKLHVSALGTEQPSGIIPTQAAQDKGYSEISPAELNVNLKNKDFALINVHVPFIGNIPQTDLSIPYDQIDQNLSQLPTDKSAKIVLYCSSGHMSNLAAADLAQQGYTNIWSLTGGMSAWQQAGMALEK